MADKILEDEDGKSLLTTVEIKLDVDADTPDDRRAWFEGFADNKITGGGKRFSAATHKTKPSLIFIVEGKRHELDIRSLVKAIVANT